MSIAFGYTIFYVENVEKTIEFYIKAFEFKQKMITEDKDYAELETGSTTLAFATFALAEYNKIEIAKTSFPSVEVVLVTEQLDEYFKKAIDHGAHVVADPEVKPWGQRVGYVRDPSGILVELCTPVNNSY